MNRHACLRLTSLPLLCLVWLTACGGTAAPAAPSSAAPTGDVSPKGLVDRLVAQAKQEGELDTATTTEQASRVPQVKDAFLKRFGLNINVNVSLGDQTGKIAKMVTTLDAGGRPEFDTLTGSEEDLIQLDAKGYLTKIDNWDKLLPEINSWLRD